MSSFEVLTLAVSLLSAAIATTSLVRTRRLHERQLKLQEVTAQLAERQIGQIEQAERERSLPSLRVELGKIGKSYRLLIVNRGASSAFGLTLEFVDCADPPVGRRELAEKFPYPELKPDSRVRLLAAIHMGSPSVFTVRLGWKDAQGEQHSEDFHVSH